MADKPIKQAKPLSSKQQEIAEQRIRELGIGDHRCPICGHQSWTANTHLMATMSFGDKGFWTSPAYPILTIHCRNCGYVMFFNAVVFGVITPEGSEPDGE